MKEKRSRNLPKPSLSRPSKKSKPQLLMSKLQNRKKINPRERKRKRRQRRRSHNPNLR